MLSETKANKTKEALPTESTDIGSYFVDIGLGVEESTLEGPPTKRRTRPKNRMVYKYPRAWKFLAIQELMVVGLEYPDLGIVKIEAEHPVLGLDNLVSRLDERRPSNWDILTSL